MQDQSQRRPKLRRLGLALSMMFAAASAVSAQESGRPVEIEPGQSAPAEPGPVPAEPPTPGPVAPTPGAAVGPAPGPLKGIVKELRSGPLLIHGNYCGIGNRPGAPPIDALDAACMRHDACTKTGKLPSCACDDRLRAEATAVARDPLTPPDVRAVATATAAAMEVLICKVTPRG